MTNVRRACLWVFLCLMAVPAATVAQTSPNDQSAAGPPPAHLAFIEGRVFIDRDGRSDEAAVNIPLADGDRLRTEDGRAEVVLADGSVLHLDQHTVADALAPDLWRLLRGRALLTVRGVRDPSRAVRYQIDAPAASVRTSGPGEYRIWASDTDRGRDVELAVSRGQATLANEFGAQDVQAGERAYAREGLAPSAPQYFNSARWDGFDRWCAARKDVYLGAASTQYLPDDLDVYASTFDRYGSWRVDPSYGNVWYPTVAAAWRPYSVGYWQQYPSWGSFWIGGDPFGWPTHHYGRWGLSVNLGWYWIPSSSWAPAWVYWGVSSSYVSWCALGYNNYPVFGNWGVYGAYYGHGYDPWRGWNVMPRHHFGAGMPVHRYGVDGRGLSPSEHGAFIAQRPAPAGHAVPRGYAGGTAVPRGAVGSTTPSPGATPRGGGEPSGLTRGMQTAASDARMQAARRIVAGEAPRAGVPRTAAPSNTPDTTAFGSRRQALPRATAAPAPSGNLPAESRSRARVLPDSTRSNVQSSAGAPPAWRRPDTVTPQYRSSLRSESAPPSNRRSDVPAATPRYAPRDSAPRYDAPRSEAPRDQAPPSQSPRYEAPRAQQPSLQERSSPRSVPSYRPGPTSGGSAGSAAPRYNPGSSAGSPRSGGSSPPSRRRGGAPDQ
jgi:hypothetical protein